MNDESRILDPSDLRKYRHEIPNIVDDMDLSPHAYRLYGHIKRRAGASGGGECYEGARKMAAHCKMSVGMVVSAKQELARAGLIKIVPGDPKTSTPDTITIVDVWAENFRRYQTRSQYEQPIQNMNTPVHGTVPPRSPNEQPCSPSERKKEPQEERTPEETRTRPARAREDEPSAYQRGSPPTPIVPAGANPEELPPSVNHFALEAHWKQYHVGFDLDTQTRVAAAVTNPEVWNEALQFWLDNGYRARSIGKLVRKYQELEAERNEQRGKRGKGGGPAKGRQSYSDRTNDALSELYGLG